MWASGGVTTGIEGVVRRGSGGNGVRVRQRRGRIHRGGGGRQGAAIEALVAVGGIAGLREPDCDGDGTVGGGGRGESAVWRAGGGGVASAGESVEARGGEGAVLCAEGEREPPDVAGGNRGMPPEVHGREHGRGVRAGGDAGGLGHGGGEAVHGARDGEGAQEFRRRRGPVGGVAQVGVGAVGTGNHAGGVSAVCQGPAAEVPAGGVHAGAFGRDGASILDSHDARGNIQDPIGEALAFVQRNIHCALVVAPGAVEHETVWDYPPEAVRETLANAVCHRDYGSPHDIQVKVLADGLVVSSPAQLPFDMPMETLLDPRHASRPGTRLSPRRSTTWALSSIMGAESPESRRSAERTGTLAPNGKTETASSPRNTGYEPWWGRRTLPRRLPRLPRQLPRQLPGLLSGGGGPRVCKEEFWSI